MPPVGVSDSLCEMMKAPCVEIATSKYENRTVPCPSRFAFTHGAFLIWLVWSVHTSFSLEIWRTCATPLAFLVVVVAFCNTLNPSADVMCFKLFLYTAGLPRAGCVGGHQRTNRSDGVLCTWSYLRIYDLTRTQQCLHVVKSKGGLLARTHGQTTHIWSYFHGDEMRMIHLGVRHAWPRRECGYCA